ncbi:ABC transporter ATP-binding protein [Methanococcoides sp.]|jgi:oligopeptide/dipeptide ABC transporter ATP-binding protein|uniref:ABC transporter ATP-binding protein n=1 Tax=Methanococcoides sp. TaxID=1966350 RepID=UPI00272E07FB|nr:ABC transporter ATP-binding protein [Methanococcoides sp.]
MSLLKIEDLKVYFNARGKIVKANNGIDLEIRENEIMGLIGETGCGKTILGRAIIRLLSDNVEIGGKIIYKGEDLLGLPEDRLRKIRGKDIGMILQNPSAALNPVLSVGDQISEIYRYHGHMKKQEAGIRAAKMLEMVGIDPKRMYEYPHQFSGGMKQRVMIAMGLALNPGLLIADEPTKGLDPATKDKIVDLICELVKNRNMSLLLITHDLGVAEKMCDRIAVMYAGEIIEIATIGNILSHPKHPYTQDLLNSLPKRGLNPTAGESPSLSSPPSGCSFHPRCKCVMDECTEKHPVLIETEKGTDVRCFLYEGN